MPTRKTSARTYESRVVNTEVDHGVLPTGIIIAIKARNRRIEKNRADRTRRRGWKELELLIPDVTKVDTRNNRISLRRQDSI
jgi:hypothetical protein